MSTFNKFKVVCATQREWPSEVMQFWGVTEEERPEAVNS